MNFESKFVDATEFVSFEFGHVFFVTSKMFSNILNKEIPPISKVIYRVQCTRYNI